MAARALIVPISAAVRPVERRRLDAETLRRRLNAAMGEDRYTPEDATRLLALVRLIAESLPKP